jgi:hypothetical protein
MKDTKTFIDWIQKYYEDNGRSQYNREQIKEIAEFMEKYIRSEYVRNKIKEELCVRYTKRPLKAEIYKTWERIELDEPESYSPKITEGDAMYVYNKIQMVREKMMKGYIPNVSEIEYLAKWSRLEYTMGYLLDEGEANKAIEVGNYLKGKIEQGFKIPIVDVMKPKDLLKYFESAIKMINENARA